MFRCDLILLLQESCGSPKSLPCSIIRILSHSFEPDIHLCAFMRRCSRLQGFFLAVSALEDVDNRDKCWPSCVPFEITAFRVPFHAHLSRSLPSQHSLPNLTRSCFMLRQYLGLASNHLVEHIFIGGVWVGLWSSLIDRNQPFLFTCYKNLAPKPSHPQLLISSPIKRRPYLVRRRQ